MSEAPSIAPARSTGRPAAGATLVLALGNPLRGDDGAGAAVLERLRRCVPLPGEVDLIDGGTPGLETVLLLQGYRRAMIIDAADMRLAPGDWRRLPSKGGALACGDLSAGHTLHSAGLAEALALGEALGVLPEAIEVFAVQPLEVGWAPGLSRPVQACIADVADAILERLNRPATE